MKRLLTALVLLLCVVAPAQATTPTRVQYAKAEDASGGAGTISTTNFTPTNGNYLVVFMSVQSFYDYPVSGPPTDTFGGSTTYTHVIASYTSSSYAYLESWVGHLSCGGACANGHLTSVSLVTKDNAGMIAIEVQNTSGLYDTPVAANGIGTPSTVNLTTTDAADYVLAFSDFDSGYIPAASAPMVDVTSVHTTSSGYKLFMDYTPAATLSGFAVQSTAGGGGGNWATIAIAMKPTGGGGGGGATPCYRTLMGVGCFFERVTSFLGVRLP